jgi:two-component system osmolarity sensor histidine kinase EnvZ
VWRPLQALRKAMPQRLFGRSLIIIVAPVVLLQGVVTFAFFARHYDTMTRHMSQGVAGEIAFLVNLVETHPDPKTRTALLDMAARSMGYQISYLPGQHLHLPVQHRAPHISYILTYVFDNQLGEDHPFSSRVIGRYVDISVDLKDGTLRLLIPAERVFAGTAEVFILWMVVSALILLAIAIIFLRNQVRPIERLALAAEAFGRGRTVPDFRPRGASEVRSAAEAFITMRARIERFLQQRTEMLAAVSHDLKTPLTRMKLQLAMMEETDAAPLIEDIVEMEHMLEGYLEFARGEGGEAANDTDLAQLVRETCDAAIRGKATDRITMQLTPDLVLPVKRHALRRCLNNLIDNALKHGSRVQVSLLAHGSEERRFIDIIVDDDGPGIPEARREEAFRPFHRLDEGRNLQAGGSGLGLAIARDIARAHGGELSLADSPLGGLRAIVRLPV